MLDTIQHLRATRKYLLDNISNLTAEQLNTIPQGFNNNIVWHLAHMISAQQGLCYVRAGAPVVVEEKYFTEFKPGTRPERTITEDEITTIKEYFFSNLDKLEADIQTDLFKNYPSFVTRYGVALASIKDAVAFLPYHEGLHGGYINALAKLV